MLQPREGGAAVSDKIEQQLNRMEAMMVQLTDVVGNTNKRIDDVNNRFENVEKRLGSVEKRLDSVENQMHDLTKEVRAGFATLEKRMDFHRKKIVTLKKKFIY